MVIIRSANETVTYYKFAKSSNVRENGNDRRQLDERSRIYFDTTFAGWSQQSPGFRISCTISFDAINGLLYFSIQFADVLFRRIVTTHHARISPTAKLAAFL